MTNDASPVASTDEFRFRRFSHPDFRWGKKVQVLTIGNIATHACVTPSNRRDFKGWFPVPDIPQDMKGDDYEQSQRETEG